MPKIKRKLKYNVSFQEMAKLGIEQLSKQPPISIEKAREQVLWLNNPNSAKKKKKKKKKKLD